jgi:5'(3')-deoxyribonucleotidase
MLEKKRVLVDCDGVLGDFATAALDLIEERTGDRHSHEELVKWNVFKAVDKKHLEHILQDAVEHEGFCLKLRPLPGAKQLMKVLEERYEVFIVTSPFLAREWVYERTRWLEGHFNIPADRIVHTKSKEVVYGEALIDDSGKNLRTWAKAWPDKLPILYDALYNQGDTEFQRAKDWQDVVRFLQARLG